MNRMVCVSLIAALSFNASAYRIYWIGNSVTDALKYSTWEQTAEADGRSIDWGRTMIPGAPISWLWGHPADGIVEPPYGVWHEALVNHTWDVVSLQPYDRGLDEWDDGDVFMVDEFMRYAKPKSPDVQYVIFAHYPRTGYIDKSGGYQRHWVKPYQGTEGGQETRQFYDLLIQKVRAKRADMKAVVLVPVGEVYFELDKKMRSGQFPGKSGIVAAAYADGIHQNDFGNYIVGCTYYATMFKTSPSGFSGSRYGVSDQDASIIKQTVWDVVTTKSFTGVTGSTRTSAPLLPVQPQTTAGSTALFDIGGRTFSQPHSLRRHAASACITRTAAGTGASALFPVR